MNKIQKSPVNTLGYNFIPAEFLPKGKNEFYLRDKQNKNGIVYRQLSAYEIEVLVRNRNTSDNWNNLLVSDAFNPELVQNCKFYGLVRIGKLESLHLEFNNLRRPVGLYNSTIISCDFGDNVVIDNVNYISHYIIGNEVIIVNVNELATTDYAKFGNGGLKEGEVENIRIWLEVCNENGGRKIVPFDGMLPGDAWLWTRYRDNSVLQQQFLHFTQKRTDPRRGYYGSIGDRTVIKNCRIFKDVNIGSDAYIKGANKLKNLTINSSAEATTQIGEGCELVNGIIDYGCRIFYGVKAVRFIMASHSQLKYGARLINSYLGNNSTISCCEVLNSLIFPAHEQHHNNSFLCAALLQGQTNMAAGATIGSNHNSRSADGEMVAGRGFWPGLCVSLKHNSRFASYTIIAKGDYPAELDIPVPFSLVSQDAAANTLQLLPAYWFQYNMYALARNSWKYTDRDKRISKIQKLEYDYLAPDTIQEMVASVQLFCELTGNAYKRLESANRNLQEDAATIGEHLLETRDSIVHDLEITAPQFENGKRKVVLRKVFNAYHLFKELIDYYAANCVAKFMEENKLTGWEALKEQLPSRTTLFEWKNVGGQLIPAPAVDKLLAQIGQHKIKSWEDIHTFYERQSESYNYEKLVHALAAWKTIHGMEFKKISPAVFNSILQQSIATREWMMKSIRQSREKDYTNPFRKMLYDSVEEMEAVTGKLKENEFIRFESAQLEAYKKRIASIVQPTALKKVKRKPAKKNKGRRTTDDRRQT